MGGVTIELANYARVRNPSISVKFLLGSNMVFVSDPRITINPPITLASILCLRILSPPK
jgi:hypothetical protein